MTSVLVIYHGGECRDGFCAAWLFHHAFPNAKFVAAQYGDTPPDVAGKQVFIVDFSYKLDVMLKLCESAESITVLDHHKTAEQELAALADDVEQHIHRCIPDVMFDMSKSGGRLAWEYLYGNKMLPDWWLTTSESGYSLGVAPWIVDYTEDRDLWAWKLPESKPINAAMRSYPLSFDKWDILHNVYRPDSLGLSRLVDEGLAILRAEEQLVAQHVRNAHEIEIVGHLVPAVNATVLQSEIAGELAKGKPFAACYFDRGDGVRVFSLRSDTNGLDVSAVAKFMGGGGHKHAAGFEMVLLKGNS